MNNDNIIRRGWKCEFVNGEVIEIPLTEEELDEIDKLSNSKKDEKPEEWQNNLRTALDSIKARFM